MPKSLKLYYDEDLIDTICTVLKSIKNDFKADVFRKKVLNKEWEEKELKERIRHISMSLHQCLSGEFKKDVGIIESMAAKIQKEELITESIQLFFIPDYIEAFGVDYYHASISAMENITQIITCEFAIRPFLLKYPEKSMNQMQLWSKHDHAMVRRLSCEGCRPRLPWAMGVPFLKRDPTPILPILENLKNDVSESVRRSVANNLNDISKEHPELVLKLAKKWKETPSQSEYVIKHGLRTLLKKGDQRALEIIGYGKLEKVEVVDFTISTPRVKSGDSLSFNYTIINHNNMPIDLRLEFAIYFLRADGSHYKKVFKISEKTMSPLASVKMVKKHSFRPITTRKYHSGRHEVSVILNGEEVVKGGFDLE